MPISQIGTNSITDYAIGATDLANNSIETYTSNAGRPLSNRNLVINGAMQVAQRGTSNTGMTASSGSGVYHTADRWGFSIASSGTWTMNVESSAPTGTEFRKSCNLICTTANTSLPAAAITGFQQRFEGRNIQSIKKGTSSAESITVSFWAKSSNTGTYIANLYDNDNTRSCSKSYTINTANTWEKKTITFPPDTTGQFDNDENLSLYLILFLAAGTDYSSGTLNTTWASATNANRGVGQLNLANLAGNYWAVTGVQLETGTVATPYEWMNYGTELSLCQRYFELYDGALLYLTKVRESDRNRRGNFYYKVTKRAAATVTLITSSTDGGGAIGVTAGIDGGSFESLSTSDAHAPNVTKFSASAEL